MAVGTVRAMNLYTLVVIGSPEPGSRVHALIHVHVLHIDMPVEMDDAHITVNVWCDPADIWIAKTVIATTDYRKGTRGIDVRDRVRDLIKRLFNISRNDKHVSGVTDIQLLCRRWGRHF